MFSRAFVTNSEEDSFFVTNEGINNNTTTYFHYTSLEGALGIFDGIKDENNKKYLTLFATHLFYLNDELEFKYGMDKALTPIKKAIEKNGQNESIKSVLSFYEKIFSNSDSKISTQYLDILCEDSDKAPVTYPNIFELSFCSDGNLLSQWKYYGKNSGIAFEFDLDNCEYRGNIINGTASNIWNNVYPNEIIYDNTKQQQEMNKIFDATINNHYDAEKMIMKALVKVSFMKSGYFQEEKEYRLLFPLMYNPCEASECEALRKIQYRTVDGIIKPYLKINIIHKIDTLPFKSIIIGPGKNQDLLYSAFVSMVQSKMDIERPRLVKTENDNFDGLEINGVKVLKSMIPFRG